MGEPCAEGLHRSRVFAGLRRQRDPAGNEHAGEVAQARQRHHHRGQALVAGGDAQHTGANGQRSRQPPQHDCGVVPIRQAVKHARRALRPPVAGVRAETREGDGFQPAKFLGGRLHEQADFPMAGVVAQSDGFAIRRPQPALGAQNEKLLARNLGGSPAHAGVLCQPKQITARAVAQHLLGQRQLARRARRPGFDLEDLRGWRLEGVEWRAHWAIEPSSGDRLQAYFPSHLWDGFKGALGKLPGRCATTIIPFLWRQL